MKQPSKPLRIALVTTYPPGQGSLNEYAFHFVEALRAKPEVGEIILLTDQLPAGERYLAPAADPRVRIDACWRFDDWRNPLRILRAVRHQRPDVVLFNIQFATFGGRKAPAAIGLTTPALLRAAGFPTLVLVHNIMEAVDLNSAGFASNRLMDGLIRLFGNIMTRVLLKADRVAVTMPHYVDILARKYEATNVFLAPHGAFHTPPLPDLDTPDGPPRVMTFGKFGTYKKVECLIEAVQLLRGNGRPRVELVIAGSDSPNTPGYLREVAAHYAGASGVTYTGYVPEEEVPKLFGDAWVTVFPYTSTTGSSGVLHQAGSYGKAAVLPNIGDLAALIGEEGYAGEFFTPDNPASLAQAIARVIDDPSYRRQLGRQNYMAACSLPIADIVDWYLLHIEQMLTTD